MKLVREVFFIQTSKKSDTVPKDVGFTGSAYAMQLGVPQHLIQAEFGEERTCGMSSCGSALPNGVGETDRKHSIRFYDLEGAITCAILELHEQERQPQAIEPRPFLYKSLRELVCEATDQRNVLTVARKKQRCRYQACDLAAVRGEHGADLAIKFDGVFWRRIRPEEIGPLLECMRRTSRMRLAVYSPRSLLAPCREEEPLCQMSCSELVA